MNNTLDRQLDWAKQQSRLSRSQMARTTNIDQQLATRLASIDRQLQQLSPDWLIASESPPRTSERLQDVESYRQFLVQQKNHVQTQRQQLATELATQRTAVLECEQRLRLLQRRDQQRQHQTQRRQQRSHTETLDRYSHQCVQARLLSPEGC